MVPRGYGEKSNVVTLEDELGIEGRALETRERSSKVSSPRDQSLLKGVIIDTSCKKSFCDTKEMAASSNCAIDESPNLHSQTETTRDECSLLESRSPNLESGPATKDVCLQNKYLALHDDRNDTCSGVLANDRELHNPAIQASSSGVTANRSEIEFATDETYFLEPFLTILIIKNNDIQQAEHLINAATAQIIHELCAGLALDERSCLRDLGVRSSSQAFVYPKPDHSWQGKFLIQGIGEIATICDGIQAHLSTCASPKMIILDELPRLTMWPSQFTEGQPTEENIALYFLQKILVGNLDGVELLIFPSNILPEKSQRWNDMLFLWGVFKGRKENNSASTSTQFSAAFICILFRHRLVMKLVFARNRVDEIPEPDRTSGDRVLLSGHSSNDNGINEVVDSEVVDLTLSLWPEALDSVELQVARALVHLSKAKQQ
ncbi:uncharacterized protein DS421_5g152660 [Arachis hypogaea]|nr:uncharacterized protein DS421_5g152660 [Arachis hypogaea]